MFLRWMGAAVLLLGMGTAIGRAQEKPPEPGVPQSEVNRKIVKASFDSASMGTEIFNKKNYEGCYRLYQGTLIALQPMLDSRPKLALLVKEKLEKAKSETPVNGAVTLRSALDEIMNDIAPQTRNEPYKTSPPGAGTETKTLWDRLGGGEKVRKFVDMVILKAAEDPKVGMAAEIKKLDGKALEVQRQGMLDWVSSVTGGNLKYSGKSLKDAHAGMKITNEQFDAFVDIMKATLKDQMVPAATIDEFMGLIEKTRSDIVTVKGKG